MKRNITNGLVILSFLSGAVGGLIYETHQTLSIILITAGLIGAIYVYISSDTKQSKSDEFQDMTAKLLFGVGIENPYTKLVEDKLAKGGTHKDVLMQLDK